MCTAYKAAQPYDIALLLLLCADSKNVTMKLSTVVLCALSVALTVLAAEEGKTFSQWEQTSGVQAKTAGGYYDKKEVKHVCLKEKEQHNCRYVGKLASVTFNIIVFRKQFRGCDISSR